MKALCTFLCIVLFSVDGHSQPEGRVFFDHMSLAPPASWQLEVYGTNITLVAPYRSPTLYSRCTISINVAGPASGGPIELLSLVDRNIPGNLEKQNSPPIQTLSNGWSATERIYRNRYVPELFIRAIAITKNGTGQVLTVSNDLSGCSTFSADVVKTMRIHDEPKRLDASGAPLKLLLPTARDSGTDGRPPRAGTVCRAGGITCLNGGPVGSSCICASTAGPQMGVVF